MLDLPPTASYLGAYLDFQDVITTKTLVVHLMISIVCIATALILDEGKAGRCMSMEAEKLRQVQTVGWNRFEEQECHNELDVHS